MTRGGIAEWHDCDEDDDDDHEQCDDDEYQQ